MARRKKRKRAGPNTEQLKKKPEVFNPALKGHLSLKTEDIESIKAPEEKEAPELKTEPDDEQYFLEAMSNVRPLSGGKTIIAPTPGLRSSPSRPARNDELEGMAHLADLVSGNAEMDITFSDEYIEGSVNGFSRKLMQRLKKGQFPVQDYLDLHRLTTQEAEIRIREFLVQSHRLGLRCVLVIHGRGLNSENHIPVLKERLPIWLSRGPVKKIVLAFSTARPYDGGTGAIYILLKRRTRVTV